MTTEEISDVENFHLASDVESSYFDALLAIAERVKSEPITQEILADILTGYNLDSIAALVSDDAGETIEGEDTLIADILAEVEQSETENLAE